MKLIRGLHNLRSCHRGGVATIGNFDGVHLGHQALLQRLVAEARARQVPSTVILFEPQPLELLFPDRAPPRLMSLRNKLQAMAALQVDQVVVCRFDEAFRRQSAEQFVQHLLLDGLGVSALIVGDDFRFGADRRGDFSFLQQAGEQHGFSVQDTATCFHADARISSTRIRNALAAHDLQQAQVLQGRCYAIAGRVRHGDKIGRKLAAPTANIRLLPFQTALSGVYVVRVTGAGEMPLDGVASVGFRPTVNGRDNRLEVHLLDFAGDLYGRHLCVEFLHYLRGEEKFSSLEQLADAIARDIEQARHWLSTFHSIDATE